MLFAVVVVIIIILYFHFSVYILLIFFFIIIFYIYINIYIMEYENKLGDRKAIFLVEASRRNNVLFDNYL